MPGLFPNPSAAPEAFKPGDQVRWYIGDAHISPYVGVVVHIHPGIQKVDVDFPVGGVQRMSPEDLILVTRFVGETTVAPDGGDYSGYDKARSDESYGTLKQNLRDMVKAVVTKKASQGKPLATAIAEKFASEVVDELASDVTTCVSSGLKDVETYQRLYTKYGSKCSDAFLRGAIKRVYATTQGASKWTTENTELKEWSERDRNSVVLEDKKSGNSIMEWWDDAVGEAVEDGFLVMNKGKDRLHQSAVEYANEHQLKPMSSAYWHKAFQDAEKIHQEEHGREGADRFMLGSASKVGTNNPKVNTVSNTIDAAQDTLPIPVKILQRWALDLSQGSTSPRWEIEKMLEKNNLPVRDSDV